MGLLKGGLTARTYRVDGSLPSGWREAYRDRLNGAAFREPPTPQGKEELEGWVQVHNLLDTSFDDLNRWLYDPFAVFALRIDKKTLPAKLFRAQLEKDVEAWAEERGVDRVPASVKGELKDKLEDAWLARTLPRVALTEVVWHVTEGWVLVGSLSEKACERVRIRFHRTFGLELHAASPLDGVSEDLRRRLTATSPTIFGGAA